MLAIQQFVFCYTIFPDLGVIFIQVNAQVQTEDTYARHTHTCHSLCSKVLISNLCYWLGFITVFFSA